MAHEAAGTRRFRGDDRKRAGHGFQGDVPERLGGGRVEKQIGARQRASEIGAGLLADEDGVGQLLFKPWPRRSVADHQHTVLQPMGREGMNCVGKNVEALLHDDPAEIRDHELVIAHPERAAPFHVAALGIPLLAVDPARP